MDSGKSKGYCVFSNVPGYLLLVLVLLKTKQHYGLVYSPALSITLDGGFFSVRQYAEQKPG